MLCKYTWHRVSRDRVVWDSWDVLVTENRRSNIMHAENIRPKGLMEVRPLWEFRGKQTYFPILGKRLGLLFVQWSFDSIRSPVCDVYLAFVEYLLLRNPQLPASPHTSNPVIGDWDGTQLALHGTFMCKIWEFKPIIYNQKGRQGTGPTSVLR